jgi:anti-sigma factor RsiW
MTHADLDDLAALVLTPDATTDEVRRHVESCADCRETAAALSDVRRLVGEEPLVPAPDGVRERVLAEARTPAGSDEVVRPMPLPVGVGTPSTGRRAHRIPAWAAGLAAGIALVAGLGLGRLTAAEPEPPQAQPEKSGAVVAAAALTALDSDAARGEASAVREDDMITLRVKARELGDEDGFHEVWLINVDGKRMVALGVLAEWDTGEFQVPRGLIEEGYRIVDISVEPDDGDPTHSGVSLARGELT